MKEDHGVETACYSGGPGEPYFKPSITCICGWGSGRCKSWEEAGAGMDEHLKEVTNGVV